MPKKHAKNLGYDEADARCRACELFTQDIQAFRDRKHVYKPRGTISFRDTRFAHKVAVGGVGGHMILDLFYASQMDRAIGFPQAVLDNPIIETMIVGVGAWVLAIVYQVMSTFGVEPPEQLK